jgi:dolichol-phosphate mannosyltransferase
VNSPAAPNAAQLPSRARAWVVLPTYNEAGNIEGMVEAVLANLPDSRHVLVVDDNSPDGTGRIADRLAAEHEEVSVLHRPRKEGLGPACLAGFREARAGGAELVIEMDSDLSHDPVHLPQLLRAADEADLVLGSRYIEGGEVTDWGASRRLISRFGNAYARNSLGIGIRDLTGGFKCYRRKALEDIELDSITSQGYVFQVETTYRAIQAGLRVVEVPIVFRDRRAGNSKMTRRIIAEAAWRVPVMRMTHRRPRTARARPIAARDEDHAVVDSVTD